MSTIAADGAGQCPAFLRLVNLAGEPVEVSTGGNNVKIVKRCPAQPRLKFSWEDLEP